MEQKCKVEEYGLKIYWSLSKPDDALLTGDLKLDLHSAHQMIHNLQGEYWVPSPLQLIPASDLVEGTTARGYKVIKLKVYQGPTAKNVLFYVLLT